MASIKGPTGLTGFTIVWIGQIVSLLGSAMSWFAFTIWAWKVTGEATTLAMVSFFAFIPTLLFSPLAGALVDRWNKKLVMMLSDLGAALATLGILILYLTHHLQVWHLYVAGAFTGVFTAFQFPAYSTAITLMLTKKQYPRAEGMLGFARASSGVLAPALAAALLGLVGIAGIMLIDLLTFLAAIGTLLWVHIPPTIQTEAGRKGSGSLWQESWYGFRYIFMRPGLLAIQLVFVIGNFIETLGSSIIPAMILSRTSNNQIILGGVQSLGAIGGVVGGALVIWRGCPKRRVQGILISWTFSCLLGLVLMGFGTGFIVWALASFCLAFFTPIVNSSDQALWQSKVAPDVQGRVFATKGFLDQVSYPIGMVLAGLLADHVFEPAMKVNRPGSFLGSIIGFGPGTGMSLMLVISGLLGMVVLLSSYLFRTVRHAEDLLPDYDEGPSRVLDTSI